MKAVASHYADGSVVRSPRRAAAVGRAEVDRYFAGFATAKSWTLEVYDVDLGSDGLVFQTGKSTLVMADDRASVVEFVLVWKRDAGGRLRIELDYYHAPEARRP
jgi:ketosteroid isomerase-like protein